MTKILNQAPASLGYTFPPEWAPHTATWFSWPRPEGISFPDRYETIPPNLAAIMREIAPRERVEINVPNLNYETIVRKQLQEHGCPTDNIHFHHIRTNESWCRDHGPAFVLNQSPRPPHGQSKAAIVDWGFNAWGGKYPPWDDDDKVPTEVAKVLNLPVFYPVRDMGCQPMPHRPAGPATVIMEGGAVDFNGRGTVMTTTSCLLNRNRNPGMKKAEIEQYLKDYYGQRHAIWLGEGIAGDDTDGHIDDLARFINPTTIVIGIEDDPKDENYEILQDNLKRLRNLKDQDDRPFDIIELPMPGVIEHDGQRLPATYMNFYFINHALLVPTYRHKTNDRKALQVLQQHLPDRQVIGIDCTDLIWGLGAIHCLTQQQPAW